MQGDNARGEAENRSCTYVPWVCGKNAGQSETLGLLVMVGVVLVLAATVSIFVLSDFGGQDEPEFTNIDIDMSVDTVTVSHEGGDTLSPDNIRVVVSSQANRSEVNLLGGFTFDQPAETDSFSSGEQFVRAQGGPYVGAMTVAVVHEPTNTVIEEEEFNLEPDIIVTVNSINSITSASGASPGPTPTSASGLSTAQTTTDLTVGDGVEATFTVENQKVPDTIDIETTFDGETVNETSVTLSRGESKTLSVEEADVDLTDGLEVEVDAEFGLGFVPLSGPSFEVSDISTTLSGGSADIDYTLANTGDIGQEQELEVVSLDESGAKMDSKTTTVELGGGESISDTFSGIDVESNGRVELSSGNDTESLTIGDGEFQVEDVNVDFPVPSGHDEDEGVWPRDNITVEYNITNTAEVNDTKDVELVVDGTVVGSKTHQVDVGETVTGSQEATVRLDNLPQAIVEVKTGDDTGAGSVEVYEPALPNFEVDIDVPEPANREVFYLEEDNTLAVTATIDNTGELGATQTLTLDTGFGTASTEVSLDRGVGGGEEKDVTLSVPIESGDAGEYNLSVSSNNDTDTADAEVFAELPELIASVESVEGSVGETVSAGLDIVTLGDAGDDLLNQYTFTFSYSGTVMKLAGITGDEFPDPDDFFTNDGENGSAVSGRNIPKKPPVEPGLTLDIELLAEGSTTLNFSSNVTGLFGINTINRGEAEDFDPYNVLYENATVSVSTGA
jgi:hypothetical protein